MSPELSFTNFCDRYAPLLWSIVRLANLPLSHSEQVLISTLTVAWRRRAERPPADPYLLSWLIGLAHQQGLPYERVQALLQGVLRSAD